MMPNPDFGLNFVRMYDPFHLEIACLGERSDAMAPEIICSSIDSLYLSKSRKPIFCLHILHQFAAIVKPASQLHEVVKHWPSGEFAGMFHRRVA
jgi:hypothetical protein